MNRESIEINFQQNISDISNLSTKYFYLQFISFWEIITEIKDLLFAFS